MNRRPLALPLLLLTLTATAAAAASTTTVPGLRVPLVTALVLVAPGVGLWRLLRLTGPLEAVLAVIVLASLTLDVVVAESLLLAHHLAPQAFLLTVGGIGVAGSLRDLTWSRG